MDSQIRNPPRRTRGVYKRQRNGVDRQPRTREGPAEGVLARGARVHRQTVEIDVDLASCIQRVESVGYGNLASDVGHRREHAHVGRLRDVIAAGADEEAACNACLELYKSRCHTKTRSLGEPPVKGPTELEAQAPLA